MSIMRCPRCSNQWDSDYEDRELCGNCEEDEMNKHTPGPWTVHTSNMTTIQGPGSENIAMPLEAWRPREQGTMSRDEMLANARLIAAAPELLEALESIRVFAQDCIENGHDRGSLGNLYSIRDLCDSNIAKATA